MIRNAADITARKTSKGLLGKNRQSTAHLASNEMAARGKSQETRVTDGRNLTPESGLGSGVPEVT